MLQRTHRSPRAVLACSLACLAAVSACSSDDDSGAPDAPRSTFNEFVLNAFDGTADDTDPTPINGLDFSFNEDPAAFDSLLD